MSKAVKTDSLSFEEAMERIETTVSQMEDNELPLDKIIEKYEEGMNLISFCQKKLEIAEKKIKLLTQNKEGTVTTSDLNPSTKTENSNEETLL